MRAPFRSLSALAVGLCSAIPAFGQGFNIDMGNLTPAPGSGFGAGGLQAGTWNTYAGGPTATLMNLAGTPTGATISAAGDWMNTGYNDFLTTGQVEALFDDALVGFDSTYTISGLAAGSYSVYSYVWLLPPLISGGSSTGVSVNGSSFAGVGGSWTGSYVLGGTHALNNVTLAPGQDLVIRIHGWDGLDGGLSGLQIVPIPAPGAASLLVVGAGMLARRRLR